MMYEKERAEVIEAALEMQRSGMIKGTSGNVSLRTPDRDVIAITPSSIDYSLLKPEDICLVTLSGEAVDCIHAPSSEKLMHLAIYRARPDVNAVVHSHSLYSTVMASVARVLPAVTVPGAEFYPVRSAPFAMPGSQELADTVVACLGDGFAVLMEHHGLVCVGKSLAKAMSGASYVEENAQIAYLLHAAGCHSQIPAEAAAIIGENLRKGLAQ